MNESVRTQIKQELEAKGISQADLARMSGVRQDYVSKILRGERVKVPKEFVAILDALDLELTVTDKGER